MLKDDLLALERTLWSGGQAEYQEVLDAECLVAFTEMAGVSSREAIAGQVGTSPRWHDLAIEAVGCVQPIEDVALLTYRATAVRANTPYRALVSSGYVRRSGGWKLMFHQQTPLPDAAPSRERPHEGQAEADIRGVLDDFTRAMRNRDAAGMIAPLTADAVTFDLAPPLRLEPVNTHDPAPLEAWFRTWQGPIISEPRELAVAVDGDIAYAHALQHMTGTKRDGERVDLWFRATAGLRREDGRWRIAHMHNSVPFAMDGSDKALLDLEP